MASNELFRFSVVVKPYDAKGLFLATSELTSNVESIERRENLLLSYDAALSMMQDFEKKMV